MAQEKKSNENKKRNGKKSGRRFGRRRENYVDSFRWGFVEGEDREDTGLNDDLYYGKPDELEPVIAQKPNKKSSKKQPQSHKTANEHADIKNIEPQTPPIKAEKKRNKKKSPIDSNDNKTLQIPVAECPLFDADDDSDLNLPSYGRTPVPTDDELVPPQKKNKKCRNINLPSKPEVQTKPNIVLTTLTGLPAAPLKPKKEQMVWDPDKREYVPLIIPEKIPDKVLDKKNVQAVDRQPRQKSEPLRNERLKNERSRHEHSKNKPISPTELPNISGTEQEPVAPRNKKKRLYNENKAFREIPVPVQESRSEKKPEPPYNETKNKTGTAKQKPQQQSKNSQELHEERSREIYRPILQHRGDIQSLTTSKIPDPADIEAEVSGFAELGVSETMLEALKIVRYLEPTPIQSGVFKRVKAGADIMGQAQTGTGKTAAFCIPIIEGVEECPPGDDPVALILVPTRELAVQVRDEAIRLAYGRDIRLTACYGGKPLAKQIARLRDGIDLVVGTPGRVLDLANRGALLLNQVRWVVLDEADRMLDIG
ncbi:MAG: DEAD/DEAH box helicase, partial [Planctomycetaceae bacterium]|nr:DEAD/DEAH box helicase [Planctomycetaceae bacterium]